MNSLIPIYWISITCERYKRYKIDLDTFDDWLNIWMIAEKLTGKTSPFHSTNSYQNVVFLVPHLWKNKNRRNWFRKNNLCLSLDFHSLFWIIVKNISLTKREKLLLFVSIEREMEFNGTSLANQFHEQI